MDEPDDLGELSGLSGLSEHRLQPLALGLDIGGTKIAGGLVAPDGTIRHRATSPTPHPGNREGSGGLGDPGSLGDPGLGESYRVAAELLAHARSHGWPVAGLGIGVPEYVTAAGELSSRLVLAWDRQPLELFAPLGPVTVDSDVRCAARAESALGAGRGVHHLLYVTVGTGLSSTVVLDGAAVSGARGEAIAFGELPVARSAAPDELGNLESFASGEGIASRFRAADGGPVDGAAQVLVLADQGHQLAQQITDTAAAALGAALGWVVDLLDPQVVVLGGGLGTSTGRWADGVQAAFALATSARPGTPPLLRAALGPDAGLIGAALAHRTAS